MAYELYPAVDESYNFPPEVLDALGDAPNLRNTVLPLTQTQRNALTGADLWNGRLIVNTTSNQINRYDQATSSWIAILEYNAEITNLDTRLDTLEVAASQGADSWHIPTLANNWHNYGGVNMIARYRKLAGIVYLQGNIAGGVISAAVTSAAFSLPVGYRPAYDIMQVCISNEIIGRLKITGATGLIIPTTGSSTWFSMNCSFPAEQ